MATPLKATYDASGNLSGFAELQAADTFNVPRSSIFAKQIQETYINLGNGTAIDLSLGSLFTKLINTNTTFTLTNVPSNSNLTTFMFEVTTQNNPTITWWSNIKWASGVAPTLTSAGKDVFAFYTYDNGTTWNGFIVSQDLK